MVGIIDYGVGNVFSLLSSFKRLGQDVVLSGDPHVLAKADRIVLPGVGAFSDAAAKLRSNGLDDFLRLQVEDGKPLLGICLGMQMLFEKSFEYGEYQGLGLLKGQVVPMLNRIPNGLKIPHIGWNQLHITNPSAAILSDIREGDYVYFVHSFYADGCDDSLAAVTEYGIQMTAAVAKGNIFGCQFHPEKSGNVGLKILNSFCEVSI